MHTTKSATLTKRLLLKFTMLGEDFGTYICRSVIKKHEMDGVTTLPERKGFERI